MENFSILAAGTLDSRLIARPHELFFQDPAAGGDRGGLARTDPFVAPHQSKELSTKEKMLAILDEVELIYDSFLTLVASQPTLTSDPNINAFLATCQIQVPQVAEQTQELSLSEDHATFEAAVADIATLLAERQVEFNQLVNQAGKEVGIESAIQALISEADKLKDQVMTLQSRLKEAEQILANALHMAKQKADTIKAAEDAQLNLDDIIRYAHRISVGFSAAAPPNWMPGDPRRPYPTEVEMRSGLLARMGNIVPPVSHILAMPTENLSATSQRFLASNAGPFTMSPQTPSQNAVDNLKAPMAANLQRTTSGDDQDVETMSSDSSSSSTSDEE